MNNLIIFIVGLVVTLIAGMGVITSTIFIAYTDKISNNTTLYLMRNGRPSNPNYKQDNDLLPKVYPRSSK